MNRSKFMNRLLTLVLCLLSCLGILSAQDKGINGLVVDEENFPIIGATIQVDGADKWAVTGSDGKFSLSASAEDMLTVSCIGYTSQSLKAVPGQEMRIVLREESFNLDESVVIGYGAVRKSDLSGSVSAVEMKGEAQSRPIATADQFLQGRIAGVNISADSGAPGAGMTVQIRGVSTLSGNTAPLYVIDGFPIEAATATVSGGINELSQQPTMNPLAAINPNDIESIQVLKDASATAIYGSRATNGVILITTKQGKEGKAHITYNFRLDISQVA
ncbi:MAG: TonB-dependent receptor plug domain-containing protein, partial [Candidatus Cryptobacteroides sp.]